MLTAEFTALGVTRMLEAVRQVVPRSASTRRGSEMFGKVRETPQTENDALPSAQPLWRGQGLWPLADGELPRELRDARRLGHPVQPRVAAPRPGVRDPQDHPRRGADRARAAEQLALGNLDAAARLGLRRRLRPGHVADAPAGPARATTSIATGDAHSVRELCEIAFAHAGLDYEQPRGQDPALIRPAEVDLLAATRARPRELGWAPTVDFASSSR